MSQTTKATKSVSDHIRSLYQRLTELDSRVSRQLEARPEGGAGVSGTPPVDAEILTQVVELEHRLRQLETENRSLIGALRSASRAERGHLESLRGQASPSRLARRRRGHAHRPRHHGRARRREGVRHLPSRSAAEDAAAGDRAAGPRSIPRPSLSATAIWGEWRPSGRPFYLESVGDGNGRSTFLSRSSRSEADRKASGSSPSGSSFLTRTGSPRSTTSSSSSWPSTPPPPSSRPTCTRRAARAGERAIDTMAGAVRVGLVVYGSLEVVSGGNLYDRTLVDHSEGLGPRGRRRLDPAAVLRAGPGAELLARIATPSRDAAVRRPSSRTSSRIRRSSASTGTLVATPPGQHRSPPALERRTSRNGRTIRIRWLERRNTSVR